jgi:hopanoid C-3 methylase
MRVNLYYAPYPSQIFEDADQPVSTVRVHNPKSALATLAAGTRQILDEAKIEAEFRIIDTQIDAGRTAYKTIKYGPRTLVCCREGGALESYDAQIRDADIHGISNNYTNSAGIVVDFARHLKAVNSKAVVVAGGMDATARPEYYIDNGVDVVVQLEGEYSFAKVIEARASGRNLADLIPCRRYQGGTIVLGGANLDLDKLPPMSLDLVEQIESYTDTGEGTPPPSVRPPFSCFETSRGCYRSCSFCATPMRGRYRYMSPAAVDKHFAYFRAAGINNILFQEDNILSRMQRSGSGRFLHDSGREEVIEIFRLARDYGFSWEFANGLEFGKFLDGGNMDTKLMEALFWNDRSGERWRGCYRVQIPLEFLGDDPARKFNKLRNFDEELEILTAVLDFGVQYQTFNVIIGHDGDDHATIDRYLGRCLRLKKTLVDYDGNAMPYFNIFNRTLLPGTKDFKQQQHLLKFDINRDPEVISVYLAPMHTDYLTYFELFERRVQMIRELNGDMIDQYDAIHH